MSAQLSVARRFEMFDRTVRGMEQRLLKVRQPPQMMAALRWGMDELDQALADAPGAGARQRGLSRRLRPLLQCARGCPRP